MTDNDSKPMEDQPLPQAPLQLIPDWQQIALLVLWKLLPASEKMITITPQDFADLLEAYAPGVPVIFFRPTAESTTLGLLTQPEAEKLAAQYDAELAEKAATVGPGSASLQ